MEKGQRVWVRHGFMIAEARIMEFYADGKFIKYQIPYSSGRLSWYQIVFPYFSYTQVENLSKFRNRIL